jgi:hypothetical protein
MPRSLRKRTLSDARRLTTAVEAEPSRVGKRQIGAHFAPEVGLAMKLLAAEHDSTVQALMREALNDLFVKYGKRPIA